MKTTNQNQLNLDLYSPKIIDRLTFMDFCAGIGGGRLGLELNQMQCLGHSEIDINPAHTYKLFFNDENNYGDLMKIDIPKLPDFNLLIAGFPCQTFSIIGNRKGMEDERGTVIYGIATILQEKNIPYFILENVKGLVNHNKGKTLKSILTLLDEIGYDVKYKVIDSQFYGVPQMRERIYLVGIRKDIPHTPYIFPDSTQPKELSEFLIDERDNTFDINNPTFQKYLNNKYNKGKFDINEILKTDFVILDWRQSDLRIYHNRCPTLRTGRHGILYTKAGKLRKLSGYEALLLQGFPKDIAQKSLDFDIANSKILSQAGNAMTVNVIQQIAKNLIKSITHKE